MNVNYLYSKSQSYDPEYDIIVNEPITVRDFIEWVLENRKAEWGTIFVKDWYYDERIEYEYGRIVYDSITEESKNRPVHKIEGRGNYTSMDYVIFRGISNDG